MKEIVRIREVATGKEVDHIGELDEKYLESQYYFYAEGNFSCDCNRKLMFGQAQGIEFSDEETPCGSSKFLVRVIVDDQVILDEL